MLKINIRTVYNNINRAEREKRLEYKPNTGRPKKLSERHERYLMSKIVENPS